MHSLSGTMAISETTLKDTILMMIDEQNKKGGVLGRKLEAVVWTRRPTGRCSPRRRPSCWRRTSLGGIRLLDLGVAQVSAAGVREGQRPAFYPVQYEGEESSKNVIYTGAAPNQQAIPAVNTDEYVKVKRWVLEGTDYVYPAPPTRSCSVPGAEGRQAEDIMVNYTPFGFSDWTSKWPRSRRSAQPARRPRWCRPSTAMPTCVLQGTGQPEDLGGRHPGVAFSVGEEELSGLDAKPLAGHLAAGITS